MAEKTVTLKDLKPGSYVMVEGEPCKVVNMVKSKPGKHGSAKMRIECMGIFDNRRRYIMKPASANADVPIIEKKKAQVVSVSGDIAQLMNLETYETFESVIPDEFKGKIDSGMEVLYWKIGSRIMIKEVR